MRIVIAGGTGYLGRALSERLLARGDEVVVLTRGPRREDGALRHVSWDAQTVGGWASELDGADAIVHLNGRRVDTRGTRRNVDELISSRVEPVRAVGEALATCSNPPPVWVQSSSLAIFGEGGDELIDERTTPSGIGLGGEGDPATERLASIVRLGLGGKVASGRQWVSWIGLDDLLAVCAPAAARGRLLVRAAGLRGDRARGFGACGRASG
jgi:NAD dependent epimerase/dehydratase family enzyme